MGDSDDVEQTLHVAREVSVYRIPPRSNAATGHRSGDWKVGDKLFSGRLRVVARGELCEIRIEDPNSGDLFAACPVPLGSRLTCVEPVSDSSRYYVLRVEDPGTRRHAFLGMGFEQRSDSFDFNEAMLSHEKHVQRARAAVSAGAGGTAAPTGGSMPSHIQAGQAVASKEVEALYQNRGDLGLKAGETIRVNLKKPATASGASTLSSVTAAMPSLTLQPPPGDRAAATAATTSGRPLAPPPLQPPPPAGSFFHPTPAPSHQPQPAAAATAGGAFSALHPTILSTPSVPPATSATFPTSASTGGNHASTASAPAVFDPFADFPSSQPTPSSHAGGSLGAKPHLGAAQPHPTASAGGTHGPHPPPSGAPEPFDPFASFLDAPAAGGTSNIATATAGGTHSGYTHTASAGRAVQPAPFDPFADFVQAAPVAAAAVPPAASAVPLAPSGGAWASFD